MIINLRESLLIMDQKTEGKYDLTTLYDACDLNEEDKKELVQYVNNYDIDATNKFLTTKGFENGILTEEISEPDDLPDEEDDKCLYDEGCHKKKIEEDMYYDFNRFLDKIKVNGPAYRGARGPELNKLAINESKFPDNMRMKEYHIDQDSEDKATLYWTTQEPFTDEDAVKFEEEVIRAITAARSFYNYDHPFSIDLSVKARDGKNYGFYEHSSVVSFSEELNEANYDGAYNIDPESYFTKEDLLEFCDEVEHDVNEDCEDCFKLYDAFLDDNVLCITVLDKERNEFTGEVHIDMEKIENPSDLFEYKKSIVDQIKEKAHHLYTTTHPIDEDAEKPSFRIDKL